MPAPRRKTHTLYRIWDHQGRLLYVGISNYFGARISQHQWRQHWWSEVAEITICEYPNMRELRDAETKAIRTESPIHNIRNNRFAADDATRLDLPDSKQWFDAAKRIVDGWEAVARDRLRDRA